MHFPWETYLLSVEDKYYFIVDILDIILFSQKFE